MVKDGSPVFIISNDIVPGMGMPVAAPGLRAFGLAEGLKAHGFKVTTVVPLSITERQGRRHFGRFPPPGPKGVEVMSERRLADYLRARAPASVVLINSNQVDNVSRHAGLRYVLDFFAPKVLELAYHCKHAYPRKEMKDLRERKLRAVELADGFIVNGKKKLPYFLAWLLQTTRDVRELPYELVNMCVPIRTRGSSRGGKELHMAMAGYLQPWLGFGRYLDDLGALLKEGKIDLSLLMLPHWATSVDYKHPESERIEDIRKYPRVESKSLLLYEDFLQFLEDVDIFLDLFGYTYEREYAMATRTVVALACGVPVVHPPFTEVSVLIREYDAGWLIDPDEAGGIRRLVEKVKNDPTELLRKRENAAVLARERLDPVVAVRPLVTMLGREGC